jgi:hypothetical protein
LYVEHAKNVDIRTLREVLSSHVGFDGYKHTKPFVEFWLVLGTREPAQTGTLEVEIKLKVKVSGGNRSSFQGEQEA